MLVGPQDFCGRSLSESREAGSWGAASPLVHPSPRAAAAGFLPPRLPSHAHSTWLFWKGRKPFLFQEASQAWQSPLPLGG